MGASANPSIGPTGLTLKAWVQFTGQGSNGACTITKSSNVTSVTRTTTGTYDVVFTAALASTVYVTRGHGDTYITGHIVVTNRLVGSCTVKPQSAGGGNQDPGQCHVEFWE